VHIRAPDGVTSLWLDRAHGRSVQLVQGNERKVPLHFEWVGDPRDQYSYPSRFCSNAASDNAALTNGVTLRATLFEDAGFTPE